jgi:hypothetical protein
MKTAKCRQEDSDHSEETAKTSFYDESVDEPGKLLEQEAVETEKNPCGRYRSDRTA